jgi:hypothetical protein
LEKLGLDRVSPKVVDLTTYVAERYREVAGASRAGPEASEHLNSSDDTPRVARQPEIH